jgi:hypothetical protein
MSGNDIGNFRSDLANSRNGFGMSRNDSRRLGIDFGRSKTGRNRLSCEERCRALELGGQSAQNPAGPGKMVVTLALIPAFSPRRRRIVHRFLGTSCDGDCRSIIKKSENGQWLFPLRCPSPAGTGEGVRRTGEGRVEKQKDAERARVREVVKTNSIRRAQAEPPTGLEVLENRVATKILLRSAFASAYGATLRSSH